MEQHEAQKQRLRQITSGLRTAFIDQSMQSNLAYKPQFVSNDWSSGKKVLSILEGELKNCEQFYISVAFITMSGITPLLQTLSELETKGVCGKILTTDYLNFSDPRAIEKLHSLSNVEIKMFVTGNGDGFHTKGYIFQNGEIYRIIVGSSNLTQNALTKNREWNTKIVSTENGEYATELLREFQDLWNAPQTLPYDAFIERYKEAYKISKKQRKIATSQSVIDYATYSLKPNSMQTAFIANLRKLVKEGQNRALLISATGTGKTFASAFAMRELKFKRVLFLVHRNQLAEQTRASYQKVFGDTISMGLVGGGKREYEKDYIFATIQTLNNDEHLHRFAADAFDCIVLDEAHHSSADSYQTVMRYFKPKLWLGMTATPDKRDDDIEGHNIYEIFNHQIAYEIRLQQAMQEDLLCPFHYFGISDLSVIDDSASSQKKLSEDAFRSLTGNERVRHIVEQAHYFGYSGERVKGLIFCSRIDEAVALSKKFNETMNPDTGKPFRTLVLSGATSPSSKERQDAFERLAVDADDPKVLSGEIKPLDYIFSVDLLNEGVDIVEVNQVIMLRPTQSPIVFIQQLGRGLRKAGGKEYVVILDFIGNYKNNFMIPIALSGDRTYNKDNIRRYLMEGGRIIPGASTIHFDEISRKRIFSAVDNANFSDVKLIRENYITLKNKLGRIPKLRDFDEHGEMDVLRIFDNNSLGSYYKFLVKYEKEYKIRLSANEEKTVEYISKKFASGKRIQELYLLRLLLGQENHHTIFAKLQDRLMSDYAIRMSRDQKENLINILTNMFSAGSSKNTYAGCIFIEKEQDGDDYRISDVFAKMLDNQDFYNIVREIVEFGISRYERDYSKSYAETDLVLYQKYTYEDVCRLLNWASNEVPLNIGGYKYDKKTKTFPVFINYDKSSEISDTIKYEDHFTSNSSLIAISKSGRSLQSDDVQNFLHANERGIQMHLFVRKNKDDKISKEFYYMGHMVASGETKEFVMPNTTKTAVEIEWKLDVPVRDDLYEYIVNG